VTGRRIIRFLLGSALAIFGAGSAAGFGAANLNVARPPSAPAGVVRYLEALRRHDGKLI
jgi:hypothetical protein